MAAAWLVLGGKSLGRLLRLIRVASRARHGGSGSARVLPGDLPPSTRHPQEVCKEPLAVMKLKAGGPPVATRCVRESRTSVENRVEPEALSDWGCMLPPLAMHGLQTVTGNSRRRQGQPVGSAAGGCTR